MNINVYLEEQLAKQLKQVCKNAGKSRNAIIREAISEWIKQHQAKRWPDSILNFKGIKGFSPFESARKELLPPKEDPLA